MCDDGLKRGQLKQIQNSALYHHYVIMLSGNKYSYEVQVHHDEVPPMA